MKSNSDFIFILWQIFIYKTIQNISIHVIYVTETIRSFRNERQNGTASKERRGILEHVILEIVLSDFGCGISWTTFLKLLCCA